MTILINAATPVASGLVRNTPDALALTGTSIRDHLTGGTGEDTLNGTAGGDHIDGLSADDRLNGGSGYDRLMGDTGADILRGGTGDDRLFGGAGRDTVNGGAGDDVMLAGLSPDDPVSGAANHLFGWDGDDRMFGSHGIDAFTGGAGDDLMVGHDGHDLFFLDDHGLGHAEGGSDRVFGGRGADSFFLDLAVSDGADRIHGGGGSWDTFGVTGLTGDFTASSRVVLADGTLVTGVERWRLISAADVGHVTWRTGDQDDTVSLAGAAGIIRTGGGNDNIFASGTVALHGQAGNDRMWAHGGAVMHGGAGDDELTSDRSPETVRGGNTLYGGAGDDRLTSGAPHADLMVGGSGSDTFVLRSPVGTPAAGEVIDVIRDFRQNEDRLSIDTDALLVSGPAPQAPDRSETLLFDTATGVLSFDADGTGAGRPVVLALLVGVTWLSDGDLGRY